MLSVYNTFIQPDVICAFYFSLWEEEITIQKITFATSREYRIFVKSVIYPDNYSIIFSDL